MAPKVKRDSVRIRARAALSRSKRSDLEAI